MKNFIIGVVLSLMIFFAYQFKDSIDFSQKYIEIKHDGLIGFDRGINPTGFWGVTEEGKRWYHGADIYVDTYEDAEPDKEYVYVKNTNNLLFPNYTVSVEMHIAKNKKYPHEVPWIPKTRKSPDE